MDPVTIGFSIAGAGALAGGLRSQVNRVRALRDAAESCGLTDLRPERVLGLIPSGVRGRVGPLTVVVELTARRSSGGGTWVCVRGGLAPMAARPAGLDAAVRRRLLGAQPFESGDPAFDERAQVEGQPPVLHALLDHGTRLAIRNLLLGVVNDTASGRTFTVRTSLRGELTFHFAENSLPFLQGSLPMALRAVLDVARRLVPPERVADRLARNGREDPVDGVRLRNLEMLRKEYAGQPVTSQALRAACGDASDVVRLYAASALGPDGRDVVRRLARSSQDDSCAARAVALLGAELEPGEVLEILRAALPAQRRATAVAGINALADRGGPPAAATLCEALAVETAAVAEAAARALQHHPTAQSQEALIGHGLGHRHRDVRLAAAAVLGRIGTVDAVLPLTELAARGPGDLRQAAREAVAAIQSRIEGAAPGQLSLPAVQGGAVTLATEGGELSLPDTDGEAAGRS